MKRLLSFAAALAVALSALGGCSSDSASLSIGITDAPVASDAVTAVYATFSGLYVNESTSAGEDGSGWLEVPIDTAQEYDLLSLANGVTAALGSVDISGGIRINQIRFGIGSIELTENGSDTRVPVELASATGLKIVNAFDVPLSGNLSLVVDFDVRKSLVYTAGTYKMKPVLRAIVEGEAGEIHGDAPVGYAVYAYRSQDGIDIDLSFTDAPNDADSPDYDDAYTSAAVRDEGRYTLAFMDAGSYDLVLVDQSDGSVAQFANDVIVESAKGTEQDLTLP